MPALASLPPGGGAQGTPEAPRCGFSARVVDALRSAGVRFGAFDILVDDAVRQGLKKLSDWPTYPQARAWLALGACMGAPGMGAWLPCSSNQEACMPCPGTL